MSNPYDPSANQPGNQPDSNPWGETQIGGANAAWGAPSGGQPSNPGQGYPQPGQQYPQPGQLGQPQQQYPAQPQQGQQYPGPQFNDAGPQFQDQYSGQQYPGQQYAAPQGGQQFPSQPGMGYPGDGQFSQPGFPGAGTPKKSRGLIIGAVSLLGFVIVAVTVAVVLLVTKKTYLDESATNTQIQNYLTDTFEYENVDEVKCDLKDVEVKADATFRCDVTVDGAEQTVQATIENDKGDYKIDQPTF